MNVCGRFAGSGAVSTAVSSAAVRARSTESSRHFARLPNASTKWWHRDVAVTSGEFDILKTFAENPNRPLSRDWLLETTTRNNPATFPACGVARQQRLSLLPDGKVDDGSLPPFVHLALVRKAIPT